MKQKITNKQSITKLNLNLTLIEMFAEAAGQLDREGYLIVERCDDGTVAYGFPTSEDLELLMEKTSSTVFRTLCSRNVNVTRKNAKDIIPAYITLEHVKNLIVKNFNLVKN